MKKGVWIILACAIACVLFATVVAADNSVSVDNYPLGGVYGDLLIEIDFTSGDSLKGDIDVSSNDKVDVYFIDSKDLTRAIEDEVFGYYSEYSSMDTTQFSKSFTWSRDWGGDTYYYIIKPDALSAEVDVEFTAIIDYDGDGYTGVTDPHPFMNENSLNTIVSELYDLADSDAAFEISIESMDSDIDLILARLDSIEKRLDDIESNMSNLQSGQDIQDIKDDLSELDTREMDHHADQKEIADENLRTAQDKAESARNIGVAVGAVGILLALIALIVGARGRKKETPYTPPTPELAPAEVPVAAEEAVMPEPIREEPAPPPMPLEPVKEEPVAPPPEPEPAPAPMAPPPPPEPEPAPAPMVPPPPPEPEPAPAPVAPPPPPEPEPVPAPMAPPPPPEPEPAPAPMAPPPPPPAAEPAIPSEPTPAVAPGPSFCKGCGTKLDPGAKFCPNCGSAV
jgi:hypothetical protein